MAPLGREEEFSRVIRLLKHGPYARRHWIAGLGLGVLLPLMVLVTVAVVVLRYLFDAGSIALQEAVMYMHGSVFLLGIGYTLKHDEHVRVDVLAKRFSPNVRRWIDVIGHAIVLLPLCALIFWFCWDYVAAAWRVREGSPEVDGIPGIYLLKTLLLVSAVLLALQGLAEIARGIRSTPGANAD